MADQPLLDRDREQRALDGALAGVRGGTGAVVLLAGPAGIGKTALLQELRRAATASGATVLTAAASPLDRDFAFGLVHQLFDGVLLAAPAERRERLLAGAAARAGAVLLPTDDAELPQDPGHAVLHGLFWLVANAAEDGPLVLSVDDLHWADRASLRFLEYLARRLDSLPVLVAGTLREHEPGAPDDLLGALGGAAATTVLRPAALGPAAVGALLEGELGRPPDPAFVRACGEGTGGNPLLLRLLARRAAARGLTGQAPDAEDVAGLAAAELGGVVRRRLLDLGPDALALATAAAVLGPPARLDDLAAVADLTPEAARAAADVLTRAELLSGPEWAFVHPVLQAAVLDATPPSRRTTLHAQAARRLRSAGARPARIAVHLLATEPAGDAEAVRDLVAAARVAAAEGAPDTGAVLLRRALVEPPADNERAGVLLELGELEARAGDPAAIAHLTAALDAGLTGDRAARALATRGTMRVHIDPVAVLGELRAAREQAEDPALRLRLEALLLEASVFHEGFADERDALLTAGRDGASPVLLAHLAQELGYRGAPADEVAAAAEQATAGGALLTAVGPATSTFNLVVHALRISGRRDRALAVLEEGEAYARRDGLRFADFFLEHAHAYWHWDFGSIASGLAQARTGLDKVRGGGLDVTAPALIAILGELLAEADRLDEAAAVVDGLQPGLEELIGTPFALTARGVVRRLQHRREEAEADLRSAAEHLRARRWDHALATVPLLPLAELLGERGEVDEARALTHEAQAIFVRADLGAWHAVARRVEGLVTGGEEGLALLAGAAADLEGSPWRRHQGWTLHAYGAALRRAGRRADAREPLRAALDLAARIESPRLARHAREELVQTGARPIRDALTGPAALTPSERRVAELAASGLTNREIAETLWVTRKTVELHLGNCFTKLGIRSRRALPDVLTAA